MPAHGVDGLEAELAERREALAPRSPPYARALELLPRVLAGREGRYLAAAWEHRRFSARHDRPLLLLAALRDDALAEGSTHPLLEGFAAAEPSADAVTETALRAALSPSRERVYDALARRGLQTDETSRAVAWLWPAALAGASGGARELALVEVGAGAGLNLVADALPPPWTDESGAPLAVAAGVRTVSRLGLDPSPLDPLDPEDARWLRACVWPGDRDREARLEAAIAAYRAARTRPDAPTLVPVAAPNAPQRLDLLSAAVPGTPVLAFQTLLRDDLDPDERDEYEAGMRAWLGTQPPGRALWVELEREGDDSGGEAALVAHVRAPLGDLRTIPLARCDVLPTRLARRREGEEELRPLLAAAAPPVQEAAHSPR